MDTTRRDVLKLGIAVAGMTAGLMAQSTAEGVTAPPTPTSTRKGDMLYRTLGSTGEQVSVIGLGGYHIGHTSDEQEAIRLIRAAIDRGITFMDNSWDYHEGGREMRSDKSCRCAYRGQVFLTH